MQGRLLIVVGGVDKGKQLLAFVSLGRLLQQLQRSRLLLPQTGVMQRRVVVAISRCQICTRVQQQIEGRLLKMYVNVKRLQFTQFIGINAYL